MAAAVRCDRCGYLVPKSQSLKSRYTGKRYCYPLSECERKLRGDLTLSEMVDLTQRLTAQIESM